MSPLHHDRIVEGDAPPDHWLLVLAGIYGAGRNWGGVARKLVRERPGWGAVPVDLRGHGSSPPMEPPHTVAACADDLARLVEVEDLGAKEGLSAEGILGHSFGGKVALLYARRHSAGLRRVFVIDSSPEARDPSGSPWAMLAVLRRHPGPFESRDEAIDGVESSGYARPVAQWMATNVERGDDDLFRWRIDVDQMEALMREYFREDAWDVIESPPGDCEIHVVKASESSVLDAEAVRRIEAAGRDNGRVHLHTLEGGHWLNADNPAELVRVIGRAL